MNCDIFDDEFDPRDLPSCPIRQKDLFPIVRCIYFAIDENQTIQYIGQTVNFQRRWLAHHRHAELVTLPNVRIAFWDAGDFEDLTLAEQYCITRFKPVLNGKRIGQTIETKQHLSLAIEPEGSIPEFTDGVYCLGGLRMDLHGQSIRWWFPSQEIAQTYLFGYGADLMEWLQQTNYQEIQLLYFNEGETQPRTYCRVSFG